MYPYIQHENKNFNNKLYIPIIIPHPVPLQLPLKVTLILNLLRIIFLLLKKIKFDFLSVSKNMLFIFLVFNFKKYVSHCL